ncbi:MAG: glycosyltransferase family 4 protein [Actinomycetota bacterium]|nr:glycosyltransferase family 4 protein [Actinomycetota bacterium]
MTRAAYLCVDAGIPVCGSKGASVHVQAVAGALTRRGVEVELLATRPEGERPEALRGVGLHALPPAPKGEPAQRERRARANDAVNAARLLALGPLDLVYERYSLWSAAALEAARAAGVPTVLEVNAPLVDEQAEHRSLVHRREAERSTARALAAADVIVAVSDGVAAWLDGWPEAEGRVHVIANGVDPQRFPAPAREPLARRPGEPFTVGFLGTLKPWHGLDTLVAAFVALRECHPEARLRIVGDGPQRQAVREALAAAGALEAADLVGAVAPAEVPGHLAAMDVAVAPYPDLRPFYFSPLKVVESMAAGLPVVASRVGALDELVAHGATGLLCPPGDPAALTEALAELAGDPARCVRMGAAGRSWVLAERTWDAVVDRVLALAGAGRAVDPADVPCAPPAIPVRAFGAAA